MKQNGEAITNAKRPRSGGMVLYEASKGIIAPAHARLHLIGHSAGAIVHSHVVNELAKAGWTFETVNFMAPAVRVDTFEATVVKQMRAGRVKRYNQLHLTEEMEQQDPTCRAICLYGRSLLYLVSESFEHGERTPILGIEKHYEPMRTGLPANLAGRMTSWSAPLAGSMSTTHGGFDDDARAMETVIKLIRGESVAGVPTATGVNPAASRAPSRKLDEPGPVATLEGSARVRPSGSRGKARPAAAKARRRR